jgi:hypothetical protein
VLRRIFGSKKEEVTGGGRKLLNVHLNVGFEVLIAVVMKSSVFWDINVV